MFSSKSAWFSSSVPPERHDFWLLEGGTLAEWRSADYLFSADATCDDTLRIFESKDFLQDKVVVFHCLFLLACERHQSVKSVCIGHYVLPPASVQNEVRKVVGRLIWDREDEWPAAQDSYTSSICQMDDKSAEVSRSNSESSDTDSSDSETLCGYLLDYPFSDTLTGYVSMDSLQKYTGDLCDFHPRCFQRCKCKDLCCLPHI